MNYIYNFFVNSDDSKYNAFEMESEKKI